MSLHVLSAERGAAQPVAVMAGEAPIDHTHLARYTLGNRPLELEVLHLFADQAPLTLEELRSARCAKSWHVAAHTLKGSARAVGAWRVARAAEEAEAAGPGEPGRSLLIARLDEAVREVSGYVARLPDVA